MTFFLTTLALSFSIFSTFCSITFYSSFGVGIYATTWGVAGFLMDMLKYASVKMFSDSLGQPGRSWERGGLVVMWIVTSLLSLIAGYGFVSTAVKQYEDNQLRDNTIYQSNLLAVKNAQIQLDSVSKYASVASSDQAQQKKDYLVSELSKFRSQPALNGNGTPWGTIGARTGDCFRTSSYYVKAYCPKINRLLREIAAKEKIIDGHATYVSSSTYLEDKTASLSALTTSGGSIHVGFQNLAKTVGIEADTLKNWVILVITIVLEVGSSFVIHMSNRLYFGGQNQSYGNNYGGGYGQATASTPTGYMPRRQGAVFSPSVFRLPFIGGNDAKLFKVCEKAIKQHILSPSRYGLRKHLKQLGHGDIISDSTIRAWQSKWLENGLIEVAIKPNGKHSYQIAL